MPVHIFYNDMNSATLVPKIQGKQGFFKIYTIDFISTSVTFSSRSSNMYIGMFYIHIETYYHVIVNNYISINTAAISSYCCGDPPT